jgi:hypothetical protein
MIALALQQLLKSAGLPWVGVGTLGDFAPGAAPRLSVYAAAGAGEGLYPVTVQVRARAADLVAAEGACAIAYDTILQARYTTLHWADGARSGAFDVRWIEARDRPTWYPTPDPGEEAAVNFTVYVREA